MKVLKILMLLISGLFVYLSLSHLLNLESPTIGAYWLVIFTIGFFILYFLVFFLDLEIISKWVSLKRRMKTLEISNKKLKQLTTSLYKLILINVLDNKSLSQKASEKHKLVREEIEQFVDLNDVNKFLMELEK